MRRTTFPTGTRVYLPFRPAAGLSNTGTVIFSDERQFRVAWDSHGRAAREPRLRTWHPASDATRFRTGNPTDPE